MPIGAAIGGASLVGGFVQAKAAKKGAKAVTDAADKSAEVEKYMYDTTRGDYAPYRQVGQGALYKLADMYGVSRPVDAPASGPAGTGGGLAGQFGTGGGFMWNGQWIDFPGGGTSAGAAPAAAQQMTPGFGDFRESPGYAFRRDEALKGFERMASAKGARFGPQNWKAAGRYVDNLASSEYENYANRLASLAGVGQSATAGTAQAGANYAQGASQAYMAAGNAKASGYANTANAVTGGITNLASAYLYGQGYGGRGGFGGGEWV